MPGALCMQANRTRPAEDVRSLATPPAIHPNAYQMDANPAARDERPRMSPSWYARRVGPI
ncbi:hypothetical protein LX32DRAFT_639470 [Colletotrichum zoysiae]|uniref:Uncharacterized protein n=1 Tax=Colletotrichum zoysiae TaxID=1216348 RepID=A0AAD9HHH5_9PEZI|nr:hypothetical protein LX32DRAFT_639470 [Colletotrichum zoysiae]